MYRYQTNNPVNDFINTQVSKAEDALRQEIEEAKQKALEEIVAKLELSDHFAAIQRATGVEQKITISGYGQMTFSNDSPIGRSVANAVRKLDGKQKQIDDLLLEYRLRVSLGKDADSKMAVLKQFAEALKTVIPFES